jgi:Kef-type K+ transport system membrane component KefB
MREKLKESALVGGLSFALPFAGAGLFAHFVAGWALAQSEIARIALSTTSLAVVYAVLVQTGLTRTEIGKTIMAATFVTDLSTVLALSILFIKPTPYLAVFIAVSAVVIVAMIGLHGWFFARYGDRVIEPEIKGAFFRAVPAHVGRRARAEPRRPARVHPRPRRRADLSAQPRAAQALPRGRVFSAHPFFFFKDGLNVSLGALAGAVPLLLAFFVLKLGLKFVGVMPVALRYLRPHATYTTLLMSTGLTFGTISSLYGLNAGIIDRTQFSVLVSVVILSAVVPTAIAQRFSRRRCTSSPPRS